MMIEALVVSAVLAGSAAHRAPEATVAADEVLSLDLKEADVIDVLRYFAEVGQRNLVVDPDVHGDVTVRLIDVSWTSALETVLKSQGLGMTDDGGVLWVAPREKLAAEARAQADLDAAKLDSAPLITLMVPVSYGKPDEIAQILRETILSPRGTVAVAQGGGLLIITEAVSGAGVTRIIDAVHKADVAR